MVLSAYPILSDENKLTSSLQINNTPMSLSSTNVTQKNSNKSLFMKQMLMTSFMELSSDEKIMAIYEQLLQTQRTVQNLLIIIGILLFLLFNKKVN